MCLRTKTSYDCGHVYRTIDDCNSAACLGLEKYHYLKNRICSSCRRDGAARTRGREGSGRYTHDVRRVRDRSRSQSIEKVSPSSSLDNVLQPSTTGTSPPDPSVNPWVASAFPEKAWETPHRKQADEAWLSEHDDRITDLQKRLDNVSVSESNHVHTPTKRSRHSRGESASQYFQADIDVQDESSGSSKKYVIEIRKKAVDVSCRQSSSGRSYHPEARQHSDESLPDSMPSYHSSPRHNKSRETSRPRAERNHEYDYYKTGRPLAPPSVKISPAKPKTEPYRYAVSSSGYEYDHDYYRPIPVESQYNSPRYYKVSDYRYRGAESSPVPYVRYSPRY